MLTMKISVKKMDFDRAMALPRPEHKLPQKVGDRKSVV